MTSTIMYKFRSGTSFEALPMPGTAARLFDVKRAIVRAKKLDRTTAGPQLEFDLSVKNANTNEEYEDEGMLLPRGTRVVVQRLPAARGYGLLARIARAEAGMNAGTAPVPFGNVAAARSGFYETNNREDEEEFEDAAPSDHGVVADEEKEIAALKAVTEQAGSIYRSSGSALGANQNKVWTNTGGGTPSLPPPPPPPPPRAPGTMGQHGAPSHFHKPHVQRLNADPELARQERLLQQQQQQKKRPTGIPRTFLNSSSTPPISDTPGENANGEQEEKTDAGALSRLQPNTIGFAALVHRGGGQSESGVGGVRRDLDYALKVTATSIPEHLQCGICESVVKNAMLIPWDIEGRTTCESCIRDGLAQNAFRCPLTGNDGVSPDDLLPNHGLRKAAELFINDVMGKMDVLLKQLALDEEQEREKKAAEAAANQISAVDLEEDSGKVLAQQRKKTQPDDSFGDDDFGGDVFDVETEGEPEEIIDTSTNKENINNDGTNSVSIENSMNSSNNSKSGIVTTNTTKNPTDDIMDKPSDNKINDTSADSVKNNKESINSVGNSASSFEHKSGIDENSASLSHNHKRVSSSKEVKSSNTLSRRDLLRKRGPPQGYLIGPAGGASVPGANQNTGKSSQTQNQTNSKSSTTRNPAGMNSAGGRGFNRGGRSYMGDNQGRNGGRGGRGRGRGGRYFSENNKNSNDGRGSQRGGQGGRGYSHQHYGPSGGSQGNEKGVMGYNQQHYGPSGGPHGNDSGARGSSNWPHDNSSQSGIQQYRQPPNDQSSQTSSKEKTSKKRSRSKVSDSEESSERRQAKLNRSHNSRGSHRGPPNHQENYRGDDYGRPPNAPYAMNFGHRGRGNGHERFNNPNLRGRGRSRGGMYREGNGYGRGRY